MKPRRTKRLTTGLVYRTFEISKRAIDEERRTIDVQFSSEFPVRRFFGREILDHRQQSVRMGWLASGRAPYLIDHRTNDRVGVIDGARIDSKARVGRARVRFGRSKRAEEVFADYLDGIRSSVSVGYLIHEGLLEKVDDEHGETWRITDWEPLEISDAALPADPTAAARILTAIRGFPHGAGELAQTHTTLHYGEKTMPDHEGHSRHEHDDDETGPLTREGRRALRHHAARAERERIEEIMALGARWDCREMAQRFVDEGRPTEKFRRWLMSEHIGEPKPMNLPPSEFTARQGRFLLDLSDRDADRYSLLRAATAHAEKRWDEAGFEAECSREIESKLNRRARGFFVPLEALRILPHHRAGLADAMMHRDLSKGDPGAAGFLVGTDHLSGSFIELLRNASVVTRLGARMLSGLVGDVEIPRQSGGVTAEWIDSDTTAGGVTASDLAVQQVALSPKTIAGRVNVTRKLMLQSTPDIDGLVTMDLIAELGLGIDRAALNGTGGGNEPEGILNATGVGLVPIDTDGGDPTWDHLVQLEEEIAIGNADQAALAFAMAVEARSKLRRTQKFAGTDGTPLWEPGTERGMGRVVGYPAVASNQLPSDLTKGTGTDLSAIILGNFDDLFIGEWGVLDVLPDPITFADTGGLVLRAFHDVDIALRHPESFAVIVDAVTD